MKKYFWKLVSILFITVLISLSVGVVVSAEPDDYYFRINASSIDVGGDFDGKRLYHRSDSSVHILVPELKSSDGLGIIIGAYRGRIAGEASYCRSSHDGIMYNDDGSLKKYGECIYEHLNLDFKVFLNEVDEARFNLFALVGVGFPRISFKNGAVTFADEGHDPDEITNKGTATFTGYSYNLGIGATFKITEKLSMESSIVTNYLNITRMKGLGVLSKPVDKFHGDSKNIFIGLNYNF